MNPDRRENRGPAAAPRPALLLVVALGLAGCSSEPSTAPVIPPLSRVEVAPATDTLQVGTSRQFSAVAYDTLGAPVSAVQFSWTSTDTRVFTVNGTGTVQGVGEGSAWLVVEAGQKRDSASVSVYPDTGWILQPANTTVNLNGVFFLPDGRSGWAVGNGGTIVRTTDAGATWSTKITTVYNLNGVWFTSASVGWAVGDGGTVMKTTGGGATWTRLSNVATGARLLDVHFASPDTGWVVGANGEVVRTFDGGASWQRLTIPSGATLNSVSFAGSRDGWAVGDNGIIAGTHDRGLSWFVVQPSVTTRSLAAVWRRSEVLAIAVGAQGDVPNTFAGPDSTRWRLGNAGASYQLDGVHFPTDEIGYAVGYNASVGGAVLRTDDGGATWEAQAARTSFRLNDVFFVDALHGWAVGNGGVVVHTARGGRR